MRSFAALVVGAFLLLCGTALGQTFTGHVSHRAADVRIASGIPQQVLSDDQRLGLQLAISGNRALILALRAKGLVPSDVIAMKVDDGVVTVWVE
jgi:hypothetical protein